MEAFTWDIIALEKTIRSWFSSDDHHNKVAIIYYTDESLKAIWNESFIHGLLNKN